MSAVAFAHDLLESGTVRVGAAPQAPADLAEAVKMLDRFARPQLAFEPPALVPEAGQWALLIIYRACQALVHREIDADAVRRNLSLPCPARLSPGVCYSADLAFHYLPDLIQIARGIAEEDPLSQGLAALAKDWPLSSVGTRNVSEVDSSAFLDDPCLRRLYADRIIEREDVSRLDDPRVRQAVREALGAYPQLSPRVAAALAQEMQPCP